MRHKFASGLLIASVIVWGVWCGGQVFNELMTIPKWSASPPESLKAYAEMPSKGGAPFFPLFNPLFVVLAVGATLTAWKSARRSRTWLALSALIAIALFISLAFYLAPLVQSMFSHSVAGDLSASEIVAGVERWKLGNRIRLAVELFGFACSVIAMRVWSAEAASPDERAA
ncbi:MAG TPA: DUF1772 domain-containing protein [Pyrinomonadaceae bacterium]|nr:DUF1772 domain-containing protein [Pyrinomonadaceae bacterium]